jgi:hypothetical protein
LSDVVLDSEVLEFGLGVHRKARRFNGGRLDVVAGIDRTVLRVRAFWRVGELRRLRRREIEEVDFLFGFWRKDFGRFLNE